MLAAAVLILAVGCCAELGLVLMLPELVSQPLELA